jgi:hypothetical protein
VCDTKLRLVQSFRGRGRAWSGTGNLEGFGKKISEQVQCRAICDLEDPNRDQIFNPEVTDIDVPSLLRRGATISMSSIVLWLYR